MSLTLTPEVEAPVEERAREEGVSPNELLARTLGTNGKSDAPANDPIERAMRIVREGRAADKKIPVMEPIETLPGGGPLEALFRKWAEEDALLTNEERENEH